MVLIKWLLFSPFLSFVSPRVDTKFICCKLCICGLLRWLKLCLGMELGLGLDN